MEGQETTHSRVYRKDMERLWNLVSFERKTIADVISYLLDQHEKNPVGDDSQPVMIPLKAEG